MEDDHCIRSIHAEANLVAWAARTGVPLEHTEVYCTHSPCLACAKLLIQAGITAFYYMTPYKLPQGGQLLDSAGIEVVRLP
jgi:dCMP deaminase